MRLDKFLSNLKYGTRTEIRKAIKEGKVTVNGLYSIEPKQSINPSVDSVCYNDEPVFYKDEIVLMLNKPKGYVSANKDALHKTVIDLVEEPYSRFDLKIVGRLDIDTEGLLLLSNNGDFIHKMIHPKKNVFKKYFVEVNQEFDCKNLLKPMQILDGNNREYTPMKPRVEQLTSKTFYLSIQEGKFHQVKRMCQFFNVEVVCLKRIAIGDIVLDKNLKIGEYKEI